MKQILKVVCLTCVSVLISGCASMLERAFTPPDHVNFYPGIGANYDILTDENEDASIRFFGGVVDFPFSLVLDTILLPWETYDYFKYKHEDRKEQQQENSSNQGMEPTR